MLHLSQFLKRQTGSISPSAFPNPAIGEKIWQFVNGSFRRYSTLFNVEILQPISMVNKSSSARVSSLKSRSATHKTSLKTSKIQKPVSGLVSNSMASYSLRTQANVVNKQIYRTVYSQWTFRSANSAFQFSRGLFGHSWSSPMAWILASNTAVLVAWWTIGSTKSGQQWMYENFAVSISTWKSRPWTLITNAFSHSGLLHYLFNMVAVYTIGGTLLQVLGNRRFTMLYLASALSGSIFHLCYSKLTQPSHWEPRQHAMAVYKLPDGTTLLPGQEAAYERVHGHPIPVEPTLLTYRDPAIYNPAIGASAAAFGLFTVSALLWPQSTMLFFIFPVKSIHLLVGLTAMSTVGLLVSNSSIAHAGHLGGMAAGLNFLLLRRSRLF